MGATIWEESAEKAFNAACEADPSHADEMRKTANRMRSGFYGPGYVERFVQKSRGQGYFSPLEADGFARSHALCASGRAACVRITIGETPGADADVEGNQAKLNDLPFPFSATFIGRNRDQDGQLWWDEPITGSIFQLAEDGSGFVESSVTIQPRSVPMEVGTTSAARTIGHFMQHHGIARWPYDSEDIWLYVYLRPPGW